LQELERNKYQIQLHQFLDRFSVNDAQIPKIGPGRKQMLASYQVVNDHLNPLLFEPSTREE